MDAKTVLRKKSYVVYLKEGSQIVDILNIMEAHVSLMELENVRILKEMRNTSKQKSELTKLPISIRLYQRQSSRLRILHI